MCSKHTSAYSKAAQVGILIGVVLILIGSIRLIERFFGSSWWGIISSTLSRIFSFVWPALLIGAGVYIVWAAKKGKFKQLSFDRTRRIQRSVIDKRISGVCGGLAQYLSIDSSLVRIIVLVLFFLSPLATSLLYIAASIIITKA